MSKEDFIQKFYSNKNLDHLIEAARSINIEYPICIPSYKNREDAYVLKYFVTHELDIPVFVFIYSNDFEESKYTDYDWPENVNIICIDKSDFEKYNLEWFSSSTKRAYIQIYMRMKGYSKYFTIDDDLCRKDFIMTRYTRYFDENHNHINGELDIIDSLKVLQLAGSYFDDWCLLGINGDGIIQRTTQFKGLLETKVIHGNYFVNNDLLYKHNLKFTNKMHEREDNCLFIDIHKAGLNTYALDGMHFLTNGKTTYNKEKYHKNNLTEFISKYPFMKFKFAINAPDGFELNTQPDTKKLFKYKKNRNLNEVITDESEYLLDLAKNNKYEEIENFVIKKKIPKLKDPSRYKKLSKYL